MFSAAVAGAARNANASVAMLKIEELTRDTSHFVSNRKHFEGLQQETTDVYERVESTEPRDEANTWMYLRLIERLMENKPRRNMLVSTECSEFGGTTIVNMINTEINII
ncbi:hypothetical protein PsorP6_016641 [Peronosclerospora sorghi]|uniref:Uncharacterized protein n=1 Tax=Peronosclerospora sorghi TaxID=230839 RepID=A0ACC0VQX1_9STRA|nr:hypothetical protein PsorP6_016641 [Peronosclerospora sorghi]